MKAIRIHKYGGREELIYEDAAIPEVGADEVLVKVKSAAVNPVDWKIREGYLAEMIPFSMPFVPGWDFSGEIASVGSEAGSWKEGDAVYSRPDIARNGTYAEYIVVKGSEIAAKPKTLSWNEAAAVPLAALTAWQCLYDAANLKEGDRVLIHAGSGGVGIVAIQLAKLRGAYVYTTCSGKNAEFVKSLGADEVIDYTKEDFSELRDLDVVLDAIGGEVLEKSFQTLKKGGKLVSVVSQPNEEDAKRHGVEGHFVFVQPNSQQLDELTTFLDEKKIAIHIDSVFPLQDAAKAHERSETSRARGKIILEVSN